MTCIMAVEAVDDNGKNVVVMGGDYLGSNLFTKHVATQPKVFIHSGMMFGYTYSFRFGQLIEHVLNDNTLYPVTDEEETYEWLVRQFVPKLKKMLKDNDYDKGGVTLIGINGQVWTLQSDFSILRNEIGFASCGSGQDHADASLFTQMHHLHSKPNINDVKKYMDVAYNVVSTFVPSVSEKYSIDVL